MSIVIPGLIFLASGIIYSSSAFKLHPGKFSYPILIDLFLVAPLAYFFIAGKSSRAQTGALRIFVFALLFTSLLFSKNPMPELIFIKKWIGPMAEAGLISFVVYRLFLKNKALGKSTEIEKDFLVRCRELMFTVFPHQKIAAIIASELSVFYYLFHRRSGRLNAFPVFTTYKENGSRLVLSTFLCLFFIETIATHFLFQLWNATAAWIITGLSVYSCLQLLAHIRALNTRPTIINDKKIFFRNGLLGGETIIGIDNIIAIELSKNQQKNDPAARLAFIKGLEKPNLIITLKEPVIIIKAFGAKVSAHSLLLNIDKPQSFIQSITAHASYLTQSPQLLS